MRSEVQVALERMGDEDARRLRRDLRRRARASKRLAHTSHEGYYVDHPGHPLGRGMPLGAPFRIDESHREGWMRVLRHDPCAFCGGPGGTLDHIEPQNGRGPMDGLGINPDLPWDWSGGRHCWTNYSGACDACNASKADVGLLEFLGRRRGMMWPRRQRAA